MLRLPEWYATLLLSVLGFDPSDDRSLRKILPDLQKLQEHFHAAEGLRRAMAYARSTSVRDAYLLYYSTANLLKLSPLLDDLDFGGQLPSDRAPVVLDVGSGPGTGLLGLVHWLIGKQRIHHGLRYIALDHARENLVRVQDCGAWLNRYLGTGKLEIETIHSPLRDLPELPGAVDLILGMNLLNETGKTGAALLLNEYHSLLRGHGNMLLMEPALKNTSRTLLQLRDEAVDSGWTVFGPCLRQGSCPALQREQDWCHHDVPWIRPDWMAALDASLGNVKLSLKFSYIILNRHGDTLNRAFGGMNPERMVSELFREKGRYLGIFCGETGRQRYQLNKRDRTDDNRIFGDLERYDCVRFENVEEREHDRRVTIGSRLHRLDTNQ